MSIDKSINNLNKIINNIFLNTVSVLFVLFYIIIVIFNNINTKLYVLECNIKFFL